MRISTLATSCKNPAIRWLSIIVLFSLIGFVAHSQYKITKPVLEKRGITINYPALTFGSTPTMTVLTPVPSPSCVGANVTLTATITPSGTTGDVEFYDGATLLQKVTSAGGVATFTLSALAIGTHALTAVYLGDATYDISTSEAIDHIVNENTAGTPSSTPTLCINTPISPDITIATTGATGISNDGVSGANGLPAGVSAIWASNMITISGTPTASGTFNYSIPLTGGCGTVDAAGTITVTADNTAGIPSSTPTLCINTPISPDITIATTGATGISNDGVSGANGLPAGVSATWASNMITISGTPTASGTFNYSIPLTGGCGTVDAAGTITVTPNNTITLTSAGSTTSQTVCINTPITNITYSTTGATGATFSGLPAGVTGAWAANVVTISGTPTASGTFNYTVTTTGGCTTPAVTATGTINVTANNTIIFTSAAGTNNQTKCINTAITNITYSTTGATGATFSGLPAGVTGAWAANVVTISGTPTASGTFNYIVTTTGGCIIPAVTATGTINVTANNTIIFTSAAGTNNQTKCINTAITNITYSTTGATGATFSGLPAGVTGAWAANVVTISGTPTASGTFNYTVTTTGGCTTPAVTATGTINVTANNTITLTSAAGTNNQTKCINTAITNITYSTTGATGATFSGLPAGVTGNWAANIVTISGSPTASGTFNYTVTLAGGCANITATGSITVNALPPTTGYTICQNATVPSSGGLTSAAACAAAGSPVTIGPSNAGTGTDNNSIGTGTWLTPNEIATPGSPYATQNLAKNATSHYLIGTNYGFAIPSGAIITGITVNISRQVANTTNMLDSVVSLVKGGTITGSDLGTGAPWPNSFGTATYGGAANLWGTTWTPADINAANFGVALSVQSNSNSARQIDVDYMRISVTYTITGLNWYTVSSGGSAIGNGSPFNPVSVTGSGLPNTNTAGVYTFYAECASAPGCRTATDFVINPLSTLNSSLTPPARCSNVSATYTATSATAGTTFSWSRAAVAGISNAAANGSGANITEALINTTANPINVVYAITLTTPSPNNCQNTQNVTVTINPSPTLSSNQTPPARCNNTSATYTATSATSGTTFSWSRAAVAGISNTAASGSGAAITETLVNTTNAPVNVIYAITMTANGCSNTQNVTVAINPTPDAVATPSSQIICSGNSITTIALTGSVSGTTYAWTRDNTGSVTGIANSGSGNISGTLTNTTAAPITVTFTITPTANSCSSTAITATVLVNPSPVVTSTPSSQTICSGSSITAINLSSTTTGASFNWTRNNTASVTGIAASGSGNISGTLTNTTSAPVTVTFTITATGNGCTGPSSTATVVVNPIPNAVATPASQTKCSGVAITAIALTGSTTGTTYAWTRDNTVSATGIAASGTGNISGTLTNTTAAPVTVTFTITPSYTNAGQTCTGTPITATVLVNPKPTAGAITGPNTVCAGSQITLTPNGSGIGTLNYTWSSSNTGVATVNSSGVVTGVGAGTTNITYTVTDANGCTSATSPAFVVTITKPTANPITQSSGLSDVCVNSTLQLTSNATGIGTLTYTWASSNTAVATVSATGLVTGVSAGTANITYTVTDGNGCSTTSAPYAVTVDAIPTGSFTASETSGNTNNDNIICAGAPVIFTAPAGNGSYIFKVDGSTVQTGTSNTYSTPTPLSVGTHSVTVDVANSSNCGATFGPIVITVNPLPTPTLTADNSTRCAKDTIAFTAGGGTNYNFKVNGSSVQSSASNIYKSATLNNGDNVTVDVTNVNGCVATSAAIIVTINALPTGTIVGAETSGTANNDNKICIGDLIIFTATPDIAGSYTYNFKVNGVSAQNSSLNTFDTSFAIAGARLVTVEVTNGNGCTASFTPNPITVTVNAVPTGVINITESSGTANDGIICKGTTTRFTTTAAGTNYVFYLNGTGTPLKAGASNFVDIDTLKNGDYITVAVTNSNGCVSTITSNTVTVIDLPTGTLTVSANPICAGDLVDFTATPGFKTYTFRKGATVLQSGASNVASNVAGLINGDVITVTVVSNTNGCSAVFNSITMQVNPLPVGTLTALENSGNAPNDNIICRNDTVVFKATGGYANYNFKLNNATVQYSTDSVYTTDALINGDKVSVEVTSAFGCVKSFNTITITVNTLPVVNAITGPTTICNGSTITLTSSPGGGVWSSSNTAIATVDASGNVLGISPGFVTIAYTITNANGCSRTEKYKDTVLALPVVGEITGNLNICTGDSSQLSDTTLNGVWSSSDPSVASISSTGMVKGIADGNVVISYTVTDAAGCTTVVTADVQVTLSPTVAPVTTTAPSFDVCVGSTIQLKDATPSGSWSTVDPAIAIISGTGIVTGVSAGTVDTHYTITNTCGTAISATATITVHPLPTATITGATAVCKDAPSPDITFTGVVGTAPFTFFYRINAGPVLNITTVSGNAITVSVPTNVAGAFTYRLISVKDASPTACSQNIGQNALVTVNPLPAATISGTTAICIGSASPNITFTGSDGTAPYTFTYKINGILQSPVTSVGNTATVPVSTAIAGVYTYDLVSVQDASTTACASLQTGSATVTVDAVSVGGSVASDAIVCSGSNTGTLTLSGYVGNVIKWESSTDGGTTWTPVANTTNALTYNNLTQTTMYHAVVQSGSCLSTASSAATITVNPVSVGGTVAAAQTICNGSTPADLTLSGYTGNIVKWQKASDVLFTTPTDILVTTATLPGITIGALTTTTYFRAVVQSGVCTPVNSGYVKVMVNPTPTGALSGSTTICAGGNATLTISVTGSGIISGTLSDGTPFSGTAPTITVSVSPAANTTYTIATLSDAICTAIAGGKTGSATVTVNPLPVITSVTANPTTVCPGSPSTLTVTVPAAPAATIVNYDFNTVGASYASFMPSLATNITSTLSSTNIAFDTVKTGTASGALAFTNNTDSGYALNSQNNPATGTWVFTLGGSNLPSYTTFKVYFQVQRAAGGNNSVSASFSKDGGASVNFGQVDLGTSAIWKEASFALPPSANNPSSTLVITLTMLGSTPTPTGNLKIDNFQVQAVPSNTYSWTASPAGASAGLPASAGTPSAANSNISVSPTVNTTYTATATNSFGCSSTKTVSVNVYTVPTVTISADYCAVAGKVVLKANPAPAGTYTYLWSNGTTTQNDTVDVSDQYKVTVTTVPNGCKVTDSISVAQELVVNGDFSAGNTGFTSDYLYVPDGPGNTELVLDTGNRAYSITVSGQNVHGNFWGHDHTTGSGNFMAINGHDGITAWKETVAVLPKTTYYFSAWAMSLNSVTPYAQLRFNVNGVLVGNTAVLAGHGQSAGSPDNWVRFYGTWTSDSTTTSADIYILDLQGNHGGNDFALDDISFGTLSTFVQLVSDSATDNQTACVNSPITNILYYYGNGSITAPIVSGLPPGLSTIDDGAKITISGTPTAAGIYTYSVTTTGCKPFTVTGTIVVQKQNLTVSEGSPTQAVCVNTPIITTSYTAAHTDGTAVTNVIVKGLPAGVTAGVYDTGTKTITISGTPTVAGIFQDTVITVGSCKADTAYGTITVNNQSIIAVNPGDTTQTVCNNTDITPVTFNFGGTATGASVSGLPAGVTGAVFGGSYIISGTPTAPGVYPYTVTTSGACAPGAVTTGTITVKPAADIVLSSGTGSDAQTLCIHQPLNDIDYTLGGTAVSASITSGSLPAGVTGLLTGGVFKISGAPSVAGVYNYTITAEGDCASISISGSIIVQEQSLALTSGSASPTICLGSSLADIAFTLGGTATGAFVSWSPYQPSGIAGTFNAGVFTISGAAGEIGTFDYTVTTTGNCSPQASLSGTIIINSGSVGGTLSTTQTFVCSGGNAFINLNDYVGNVVRWESSVDGGATWTNISTTNSTLNPTNITVPTQFRALVKSGSCNGQYSSVITVGVRYYWVGISGPDWNVAANWSNNEIPASACNMVTIPSGAPNQPRLVADLTVPSLTIMPGATVDLNSHILTVNGAFVGTGKLIGSAISGLVINTAGDAGTVYFDTAGSNNQLKTLTVAQSTGKIKLGNDGIGSRDTVNIVAGNSTDGYGTVTSSGILDANGVLTLKSNAGGTARVGYSSGSIIGNATVERYIPGLRAWRFLTVPFNTSSQKVRDAWQEGVNNFGLDYNTFNRNPHPGYGTHITGDNNSALGWDFNTTQNPSYKVWNPAGTGFNAIEPPTISTLITDYRAYCIFIRGSRAVNLSLATGAPTDPTVLRATGVLNQTGLTATRSYSVTSPGTFAFIGNPYASAINLRDIIYRSSGIDTSKFWLWDPKIVGSGTDNVGGYVSYSNGVVVPLPSPSYPTFASVLKLESGQAFMVQLKAGSTAAIMDFRESDKIAEDANVFGLRANTNVSGYPVIYTNLMLKKAGVAGLVDGVGAGFSRKFSSAIDANDAMKLWNFDENIALMRDGQALAIELRQPPVGTDTLFYKLLLKQKHYALQIFAANLAADSSPKAWLVDKYLNKKIVVNLLDTTVYNFVPNADSNSYQNRFMLVFRHIKGENNNTAADMANINTEGNVVLYPNPVTTNKATLRFTNMARGNYEVTVYSSKGQKLASRKLHHNGGSNAYTLPLDASWAGGVYSISIIHEDSKKAVNLNLVISR